MLGLEVDEDCVYEECWVNCVVCRYGWCTWSTLRATWYVWWSTELVMARWCVVCRYGWCTWRTLRATWYVWWSTELVMARWTHTGTLMPRDCWRPLTCTMPTSRISTAVVSYHAVIVTQFIRQRMLVESQWNHSSRYSHDADWMHQYGTTITISMQAGLKMAFELGL